LFYDIDDHKNTLVEVMMSQLRKMTLFIHVLAHFKGILQT